MRPSVLTLLEANEAVMEGQSKAVENITTRLTETKAALAAVQRELWESRAENAKLAEIQRSAALQPSQPPTPQVSHHATQASLDLASVPEHAALVKQLAALQASTAAAVLQLQDQNARVTKELEDLRRERDTEHAAHVEEASRYEEKLMQRDQELTALYVNLNTAEAEISKLRASSIKPNAPPPLRPVTRDVALSVELLSPLVPPIPSTLDWVSKKEHDAEVQDLHQEIGILTRRLERANSSTFGATPALGPNGETAADYEQIIAELKKELAITAKHLETTSQRNKVLVENKSASVATAVSISHRDHLGVPTSAAVSGRKSQASNGVTPTNGSTRASTTSAGSRPLPKASVVGRR